MKKQLARLFGLDTSQENIVDDPDRVINVSEAHVSNVVESTIATVEIVKSQGQEQHTHNIRAVALAEIDANPFQPRKNFCEHTLEELSQSIREYGVIQPILLRKTDNRYELIAGERRFRAAKLAGLDTIPAIVKNLSEQETAEIAMIENLQREDLNFLEEAEGYQTLLNAFGLTQEELARRVGKNQSTIANKLRLLKLPSAVRKELSHEAISERHARALLRLPGEQYQLQAIESIKKKEMTVRQAEEYIEQTLTSISREIEEATPKQKIIKIFKDIRIFINTIHSVVNEMRKAGLDIQMTETNSVDDITIHLKISKRKQQKDPLY